MTSHKLEIMRHGCWSSGEANGHIWIVRHGLTRYESSHETRAYANAPRDRGVGLDLMGARFYAPELGVWTQADPLAIDSPEQTVGAEFGTANPYAYANLTPVVANDPTGEFWHVVAGGVGGALLGGGIEAARQYVQNGKVEDWGRVGAAAAGGAVSGIVQAALPGVGTAAMLAVGASAGAAGGATERLIDSGGRSAGSLTDLAVDASVGAATGGVVRGASKVLKTAAGKDDLLDQARAVRDARAGELGSLRPPTRPATVSAGYNARTGQVATGCSGGGACAEQRVFEALGGNAQEVRFTEAVRPRPQDPPFREVPVCTGCETRYGRDVFPEGTKFQSNQ